MENHMLDYLHERVSGHDVKLESLMTATQNLALTATKHDVQLAILMRIMYFFCTAVVGEFVYKIIFK